MRRYWLAAHLYLGLVFGGILVMLGLTGSLLVFYLEIDRTLNPAIAVKQASRPSLEAVLKQLQQAHPQRKSGWRIELPLSGQHPLMARYMKPQETRHLTFAPLMVTLDPATLEITSQRFWGQFTMTWLYDLHYTLLLEDTRLLENTGKTLLAACSIVFMISLFSGLYLWWPRHGNFKAALSFKKNAHPIRRIYDWHKLSGVFGFVFLLMLTITGLMLEKPDWFKPILAMKSPLFEAGKMQSKAATADTRASLDAIAKIAQAYFLNSELRWIYTPDDASGAVQIRLYQTCEPSRRFPKTTVWLDQYSAKIIASRDACHDTTGDKVQGWLHPLHNGEAFGLIGRWLVFFSGILPAILMLTGFIRWRHKKKAKRFNVITD